MGVTSGLRSVPEPEPAAVPRPVRSAVCRSRPHSQIYIPYYFVLLELGMTFRVKLMRYSPVLLATLLAAPLVAQQRVFTAADYDRGARFLAQNMTGLVVGGSAQANWLPDERFV